MARFGDNPLKNPLTGNEVLAAQDPSTGNDIGITPLVITQFVGTHLAVANGSSNGLIDAAAYAKLLALYTQAQTDIRVSKLAEVAIPIFFAVPTNGTFAIYQHVLDIPWVFERANFMVSAGSTNVTILKNGVAIPGFTNIPAASVAAQYLVSGGSSNYTLNYGDTLSISFAGTTGNAANLAVGVKANATIPS